MKRLALLPLLGLIAGCGGMERNTTFTCPNGPDLAVTYADDTATIGFSDGRVETLTRTSEDPEVYSAPGMVWRMMDFATARLDDDRSSFRCDQLDG